MSHSYLAFDTHDGSEVAWSVLQIHDLTSEQKRKELQAQFQLLLKLDHPNLVRCKAAWLDSSKQVAVRITDLFSKDKVIQKVKGVRLPLRQEVRQLSLGILNALAYLHSQEPPILVKSLSTNNIVVVNGQAKLTEYGLDSCFVSLGSFSAVKEYSAPEMYTDQLSPSVDVYSFGLCLLEIITRERPYLESPCLSCTVKRKLNQVAPRSLERVVDVQLKDLIDLCLCKQRPTASELLTLDFFTEPDAELDGRPVEVSAIQPKVPAVDLFLAVTTNDGHKVAVEFKYQPTEDTPESVARQLAERLELPPSKVINLSSEIRKLVALEDSKLMTSSLQLIGAVSKVVRRKASLIEMEPVESLIPVSIRLLLPDVETPCKVDFSYVLNVDKPDLVADELIRELKLTATSKLRIEEEIRKLIRTKQKVTVGLQTDIETSKRMS
jgi:WNK lysine deficient protein kinase